MNDFILAYWPFFAIFLGIAYLVAKYGKMEYERGRKAGYNSGLWSGHLKGIRSGFEFLEKLGFVNLDDLETKLKNGEFDHVGDIANTREKIDTFLKETKG